jgi:probable F420-dependent oxidoreductase
MSVDGWAEPGAAREQLGRIGVWSGALAREPWATAHGAVARIEELGYAALWISESLNVKEPFAHAGLLLEATERLPVATGIANIWVRDPAAARNAAYTLAEAHPGRFTLGIGVSHKPLVEARGHDYARPLTAMRTYLDGLGAIPWAGPPPAQPVPLVLAALRPRMLELAATRATGAHPYFTPVEHTARARAALGPEPLLAPEVAIVLETDATRARERARAYAATYLRLPNYTNNLRDLGYGDDDLAGGGSDRLIDAVIPCGDEAAIARRVGEHLDAGADHVCVQPVGIDLEGAVRELERLGPALLG